jgi:hypothetical protein
VVVSDGLEYGGGAGEAFARLLVLRLLRRDIGERGLAAGTRSVVADLLGQPERFGLLTPAILLPSRTRAPGSGI